VSCIVLTDPHRRLLTALTGGPRRVDDLDGRDSLDELRRWETAGTPAVDGAFCPAKPDLRR